MPDMKGTDARIVPGSTVIYTQRTQKNRGEIDKREHSARVLEVRPRRVVIEVRIDGVLRCMRVRSHLVRALSA